jgi:hypothetical protein
VAVDTILREGKDLGSLSFEMDATPESISLTAINGILDGVTLGEKNQVDWTLGEGAATSASIDFQLGPAASTLSVVNTDSSLILLGGGDGPSFLGWFAFRCCSGPPRWERRAGIK